MRRLTQENIDPKVDNAADTIVEIVKSISEYYESVVLKAPDITMNDLLDYLREVSLPLAPYLNCREREMLVIHVSNAFLHGGIRPLKLATYIAELIRKSLMESVEVLDASKNRDKNLAAINRHFNRRIRKTMVTKDKDYKKVG
jgi:ATP-dependent RNA circularization protein (DNA/RNA ligase family)